MNDTQNKKAPAVLSLLYIDTAVLIVALIILLVIKTAVPDFYADIGGYLMQKVQEKTSVSLVLGNEKTKSNNTKSQKVESNISSTEPVESDYEGEDSETAQYEFDFSSVKKLSSNKKTLMSMSLPILPKKVTSQFGYRVNPVTGNYGIHGGIDLAADTGTKIHPALPGTVIKSKFSSDYGNFVMIDHGDNVVTLYAHCSKLTASVGDKVDTDDVIALVGSTGHSTGPHLHFEVRINDVRINPVYFLTELSKA